MVVVVALVVVVLTPKPFSCGLSVAAMVVTVALVVVVLATVLTTVEGMVPLVVVVASVVVATVLLRSQLVVVAVAVLPFVAQDQVVPRHPPLLGRTTAATAYQPHSPPK